MDNAPSVPNRAGTKVEAAGRPRTLPDRELVRGLPIRSTAVSQSRPKPKPAAAPQPPDRPSRHTLDRFLCFVETGISPTRCVRHRQSERENLSQILAGPARKRRGSSSCPISRVPSDAFSSSTVSRKKSARSNPRGRRVPSFPARAAPPQPPLPPVP